jgi:hypothetical protein
MKISQTYRTDFASEEANSVLPRPMQRLGLPFWPARSSSVSSGRSKRLLRSMVSSGSSSHLMVSRLWL